MALKKILVNPCEDKTFRRLLKQAEGEEVYVCPKVSLKDVVPFENTQLSRELRNFCWTAHSDFVVMTGESEPLFAVEFDGPSHDEPIQEVRDRKKDELCKPSNWLTRWLADSPARLLLKFKLCRRPLASGYCQNSQFLKGRLADGLRGP